MEIVGVVLMGLTRVNIHYSRCLRLRSNQFEVGCWINP